MKDNKIKGDIKTKWPQPFLGFWGWNFAWKEVLGSHLQKYRRLKCFQLCYRVSQKDGKYGNTSKMDVLAMEYHSRHLKYLHCMHNDQYFWNYHDLSQFDNFLGHPVVFKKKFLWSFEPKTSSLTKFEPCIFNIYWDTDFCCLHSSSFNIPFQFDLVNIIFRQCVDDC